MKKNVWIIGVGEPLPIDGNNERLHRSGSQSFFLSKYYDVKWISSDFNHSKKVNRFSKNTIHIYNNLELHILKTIPYKKNISFMRILSNFIFSINLFFYLFKIGKKKIPDVILCSFPPIENSLVVIIFCKIYGIKSILDVRDAWPEIFYSFINKKFYYVYKIFFYVFEQITKISFRHCNYLISITPPMLRWAQNYSSRKKNKISFDKFFYFSYTNNFLLKKEEKKFIVTHIGNLSHRVELETVISAAKEIEKVNDEIKFYICGRGELFDHFNNLAKFNKNVEFTGWIDKIKIKNILSISSIGIIPYASSLDFKMSIPNKVSEYMSFSLPILNSIDGYLAEIIDKNMIGLNYENRNVLDLKNKILEMYSNKKKYKIFKDNSKNFFLNNFEETTVNQKFKKMIDSI